MHASARGNFVQGALDIDMLFFFQKPGGPGEELLVIWREAGAGGRSARFGVLGDGENIFRDSRRSSRKCSHGEKVPQKKELRFGEKP